MIFIAMLGFFGLNPRSLDVRSNVPPNNLKKTE